MRLIDADALKRWLQGKQLINGKVFEYAIDDAPTIEATPMQSVTTIWTNGEPPVYAPIRHGHWIEDSLGDCCYKCSECGFVRDAYLLEVETYCPNCGAKMDGAIERVKYGEPNFPW